MTVLKQPITQNCTVSNGKGTMSNSNVTNVGVSCVTNNTTLTTSVSNLALSVAGLTEYGISGTPKSGVARTITITNTGTYSANNLVINYPVWPTGTTTSSTCGTTLAIGASCTITIHPGTTTTSDGTNPCSKTGTAPVPGTISISAENASTISTKVVVLDYGCIHRGGLVFCILFRRA